MQDLLGAGYHLSQSRFIVYASCSVGRSSLLEKLAAADLVAKEILCRYVREEILPGVIEWSSGK